MAFDWENMDLENLKAHPFMRWAIKRIKRNKNIIIAINGPTGSGKTYSAITLAMMFAKVFETNFTIDENVDFNFADLLAKTEFKHNMKPGTPFIFEEVGAFTSGAASRTWQSKANRFFFSFMQTTRHRNQILIFTCPHFSFLEKGSRSLCHMQMEMSSIDMQRKIAFLKPFKIQVNPRSGKFYFKYIRYSNKHGKGKLRYMECPKPPKDVCAAYEKIKTRFTGDLNKQIREDSKPKEKKSEFDTEKMLKLIDKGVTKENIAKIMGVTRATVYNRLRKVKTNEDDGIIFYTENNSDLKKDIMALNNPKSQAY